MKPSPQRRKALLLALSPPLEAPLLQAPPRRSGGQNGCGGHSQWPLPRAEDNHTKKFRQCEIYTFALWQAVHSDGAAAPEPRGHREKGGLSMGVKRRGRPPT